MPAVHLQGDSTLPPAARSAVLAEPTLPAPSSARVSHSERDPILPECSAQVHQAAPSPPAVRSVLALHLEGPTLPAPSSGLVRLPAADPKAPVDPADPTAAAPKSTPAHLYLLATAVLDSCLISPLFHMVCVKQTLFLP